MIAQTSARALVAWTCDTFCCRNILRNARAKRACAQENSAWHPVRLLRSFFFQSLRQAGFARHSASSTIASGKNSSDGASCSIAAIQPDPGI